MSLINLDKHLEDTWGIIADEIKSAPQNGDNCRLIWWSRGTLHHTHTLFKHLPHIWTEIYSHHLMEPDEIWAYVMRLKVYLVIRVPWTLSQNVEIVVPDEINKDIELYNALLGE